MAQTKKKRQRKRRGTQGGRIDSKARAGRPRSREEAKARARSGRKTSSGTKADLPPTWRGSAIRGLFAAVIFGILLLVIFKRPAGVALAFAGFMLAFYIPAGYYIDTALWRKRERQRIREREG
jgi:Flp pilus assembly protein TadB